MYNEFVQKGTVLSFLFFVVLSIIHLYFCYFEKKSMRKITKPFLMLFLLIGSMFYIKIAPYIVFAIIFALLGDIFLIWNKNNKFFILGAISFSISHIINFINIKRFLPFTFKFFYYLIIAFLIFFITIAFLFSHEKR